MPERRLEVFAALLAAVVCATAAADDIDALIERAKKRDPKAQYSLALRAYEGEGVPRSPSQAFRLMQQAAGAGLAEAQNALGFYYQHGIGTEPDAKLAAEWFRKAAPALPEALYNLAYTLEASGADPAGSRAAYEKASGAGVRAADLRLGMMLEFGRGGPADADQALARYERAAAAEVPEARAMLKRLLALQAAAVSPCATSRR